ncbi:MAG: cell wall-binding repeat-containing protein, partial [Clostridia bacterium]|nr:cell wall-binding repeat-containing protein [Clostridia bacterium]
VYGSNRFDTAFGAADLLKETLGVDKFDNVIVACGTNFADALAGSYLGKVKNAPILLVQPNVVPTVRAYIEENLKPGGTVYLLGGETIVPGSVSEGLTQFITKRLWGANRYETNLAILKEAGVTGGEILVCTGYGFADSLSASAVGKPILLVDKRLDAKQMEYLSGLKNDSYVIVGGVGAVNETVEASLKGYGKVERLAGANRFTTSVMVAERFFDDPTTAVVAYANNFPDGLCGGPLAAAMGGPLLLTANNDARITAEYTAKYGIQDGVVLGGPGLISDAAVRKVFAMRDSDDILLP